MNELWRVQGATGAVRMMSLDDIDRAFNAGYLNAHTYVLAPGSMQWQTLGDAAGLDDPEPTPSLSPVALSNVPAYQLPEIPQHQPLSFDGDELTPQKSRKGIVFGFAVAAAAAACVFAVKAGKVNLGGVDASGVESVAAVAPPVEMKLPAPVAVEEPKAEPSKGLSDDTKQRLLDADKAKAKKNAKGKHRLTRNQAENDGDAPIPKSDAKPLVEGGDKFDPLNGSL